MRSQERHWECRWERGCSWIGLWTENLLLLDRLLASLPASSKRFAMLSWLRHCVKLQCLRGFNLKQVSEDAEPRTRCTKGIGKALCSLQNRCSMVHQQTSANGFMVQWSEKVLNYVWIRSILFNGGWMDNFTAICDENMKTRQSPSKSGEEKWGRESRVQKPHATLKLYNTADLQTNKTGTRLALDGSGIRIAMGLVCCLTECTDSFCMPWHRDLIRFWFLASRGLRMCTEIVSAWKPKFSLTWWHRYRKLQQSQTVKSHRFHWRFYANDSGRALVAILSDWTCLKMMIMIVQYSVWAWLSLSWFPSFTHCKK